MEDRAELAPIGGHYPFFPMLLDLETQLWVLSGEAQVQIGP